jgi:hypothetical protein
MQLIKINDDDNGDDDNESDMGSENPDTPVSVVSSIRVEDEISSLLSDW